MKKSSFAAMVLGVISTLFFGTGMSMALTPEWNAFTPGIVLGAIGLVFALITLIVWRRMEHKAPIKLSGRTVLTALFGIAGALVLGVGLCLVMVWNHLIFGILLGIVGIMMLMGLVPMAKGFR